MQTLKIATYNIHKGFSQFNRRVVLHELRDRLRELDADIVFLQEAQGEHTHHAERHHNYPGGAQHEFIAEEVWPHCAYGKNAVYEAGHHGNAILSRFPIVQSLNMDVSAHRFESRGLLHCEIDLAERQHVHCVCAHFGLFAKGKRAQTRNLIEYVRNNIPPDAPLIIAGDFNDWRNLMSREMSGELGMHDVFHLHGGRLARSYPAGLPLLRLDRIYVRGFSVRHCDVHTGGAWQRLSDHAALSAQLNPDYLSGADRAASTSSGQALAQPLRPAQDIHAGLKPDLQSIDLVGAAPVNGQSGLKRHGTHEPA